MFNSFDFKETVFNVKVNHNMNFFKILLLLVPATLVFMHSQPVLADCSVTSGGGTVTSPANGAVVTCVIAGGDQTSAIGDGTDGVSASVDIQTNAVVDVTADAVSIDDLTISIASGATLQTTGNGNNAIASSSAVNSVSQNITLLDNSSILTNGEGGASSAIYAYSDDNSTQTVTLSGDSAQITTQGDSADAMLSQNINGTSSQTVVMSGDNTLIQTQGFRAEGVRANSNSGTSISDITLSGSGAQILTAGDGAEAIFTHTTSGTADQTVVMSGDNTLVRTQGENAQALYSFSRTMNAQQTLTLSGDNARIEVTGTGSEAVFVQSEQSGTAQTAITMASNTSIISVHAEGIKVSGAAGSNPASTIDTAGFIQGGTNSILLDDGNDSLILRTGSNLSSVSGADLGAGSDVLTLIGNGSENEIFLNVETAEVNANSTGWELTSTSTFDDINIKTGLFRNNGNLTVNNFVTVDSGASFGGTGTTVGNVVNNGISSPGNSVGTQVINGNFVQNSTGTLKIEFDNTGIDLLDISGTATLDGTLELVELSGGVTKDTSLTFLEADGGITGDFSTITKTFLSDTQIFNATVSVNGTLGTVSFDSGTGLENSLDDNSTDSGQDVIDALNNASSDDASTVVTIANTINSSPSPSKLLESQSGTVTINAMGGANNALGKVTEVVQGRITNNIINNTGSSPAPGNAGAAPSQNDLASIEPAAGGETEPLGTSIREKNQYWIQAVGGFGTIDSDTNARGSDFDTFGTALGVERLYGNDKLLGVFGAYSITNAYIKDVNDDSTSRSYQAGLYGLHNYNNGWSISGSLSAAYLDFETNRYTNVGIARGDFDGLAAYAYTELQYDIIEPIYKNIMLSPYLGAEGSVIYHEKYIETGAGVLNMSVDSNTTEQFSSLLGVKLHADIQRENFVISPLLRVAWAHQYLDKTVEQTSSFASAPSAIIGSEGSEQYRDSARIGLDLSFSTHDAKKTFYTSYDADIASDHQDHRITVGFKWNF